MSTRGIGWIVLVLAALLLYLAWPDRGGARVEPPHPEPVAEGPRLEGTPDAEPEPSAPKPEPAPREPEPPAERRTEFRVVDAEDLTPLSDARFQITWTGYRVEPLGKGRYALVGQEQPFDLPIQVTVRAPAHMSRDVTLEKGAVMPSRVTLDPAGVIRGVVRLEGGAPAPGTKVRAGMAEGVSDDEGAYCCEPIPLRKPIVVRAESPIGRGRFPEPITLQPWRREARVDLTVVLGLEHEVVVQDRMGYPIEGARVGLDWSDRRFPPVQRRTRTGVDGRAVLAGLRPCTALLLVSADGYEPRWLEDVPLPGEPTVFVLHDAEDHWVGGTVVDTHGMPIAGVRVEIRGDFQGERQARTDRRGNFKIHRLRLHPRMTNYGGIGTPVERIYLVKRGYSAPSYVAPFDRVETFPMARPFKVKGRVLFPDGRPVRGPSVSVWWVDVGPRLAYTEPYGLAPNRTDNWGETAADGTFVLEDLMAAPCHVGVGDGKGRFLSTHVRLDPRPGAEVDLGDLVLAVPGEIRGRLVGTSMRVEDDDLRLCLFVTDVEKGHVSLGRVKDGSYVRWSIRAGTYRVFFQRPGWVSGTATVTVDEGGKARADLDIWRATSITVALAEAREGLACRLRYEGSHRDVHACRGWHVDLEDRPWKVVEAEAADELPFSSDGKVTFDRLPPGRYVVEVFRGTRVLKRRTVDLREAQDATIQVDP